jgi:hypothetical protein
VIEGLDGVFEGDEDGVLGGRVVFDEWLCEIILNHLLIYNLSLYLIRLIIDNLLITLLTSRHHDSQDSPTLYSSLTVFSF